MSDEILKREGNYKTVGAGISTAATHDILMFRIDPITNGVLANMVADSLVATSISIAKRDENFVPTIYGISDTDGITLVPIRTDDNGYLLTTF